MIAICLVFDLSVIIDKLFRAITVLIFYWEGELLLSRLIILKLFKSAVRAHYVCLR